MGIISVGMIIDQERVRYLNEEWSTFIAGVQSVDMISRHLGGFISRQPRVNC